MAEISKEELMDALASSRLTVIKIAQAYAIGMVAELYLSHDGQDPKPMYTRNDELLVILTSMTKAVCDMSAILGVMEQKYVELDEMMSCIQLPDILPDK